MIARSSGMERAVEPEAMTAAKPEDAGGPAALGLRLREARVSEGRAALAIAAGVRVVGASLFLAVALVFGGVMGLRDWSVYTPILAPYLAIALMAFALRRTRAGLAFGPIAAIADVAIVYVLQRRSSATRTG
jgi:hypothetical protein